MNDAFWTVLRATGPHPSLGRHADTYGRVIGSWLGEIRDHFSGPSVRTRSIEAHFAWVLEGRAVQDVWITPSRPDRAAAHAEGLDWYGTTLRVFAPSSESWRVVWSDPVSGHRLELEGRRHGDDVVQIGTRGGRPIRWTFTEIADNSFRWQGHVLDSDGISWRLEVDMHFRRASVGAGNPS